MSVYHLVSQGVVTVWTPDLSGRTRKCLGGKNLTWKCLECWNAAVGVDEGKNITSANQHLSSTNDGKQIYGRT